ncbi:MAG: transcription elongation factor GreA [Francisellaceae bacterium]|jgi:transcription elongation factor GreA|nr:transcription elongation factor GreA [Francisellaceae bacterium]MBT6207551.1 transcription elongation factor GreA [Francisellaceae bacterium]MBT6538818.1 transcription elongation factor GreA [Francisellaceae bacterium]
MSRVPMTAEGEKSLQSELHNLKTNERQRVIADIAEARAHGDLKENAEYHAAREQQGFIEGRIQEIESKLSVSLVVDVTKMDNQGKVIFGSTVILFNEETKETVQYAIVGQDEANIKSGKVSVGSPLARALIGKMAGDEVDVQTPSGITVYSIEEVLYV